MLTYNLLSRKIVFERFWLYSQIHQFQPTMLGSPKLDASISATLEDMRNALSVVKGAQQKDWLAEKWAICVAWSGSTTEDKQKL